MYHSLLQRRAGAQPLREDADNAGRDRSVSRKNVTEGRSNEAEHAYAGIAGNNGCSAGRRVKYGHLANQTAGSLDTNESFVAVLLFEKLDVAAEQDEDITAPFAFVAKEVPAENTST